MYHQIRINDEDILLLKEKGYTGEEINHAIATCFEIIVRVFHATAKHAVPANERRQQIEDQRKLTDDTDPVIDTRGRECDYVKESDQTDDFNKWVNNLGGKGNDEAKSTGRD